MWWIAQVLISILILSKNRYCHRRTTYWFDSNHHCRLAFFFSFEDQSVLKHWCSAVFLIGSEMIGLEKTKRDHIFIYSRIEEATKNALLRRIWSFFLCCKQNMILIFILDVFYRTFFSNLDFSVIFIWYENLSVGLS